MNSNSNFDTTNKKKTCFTRILEIPFYGKKKILHSFYPQIFYMLFGQVTFMWKNQEVRTMSAP